MQFFYLAKLSFQLAIYFVRKNNDMLYPNPHLLEYDMENLSLAIAIEAIKVTSIPVLQIIAFFIFARYTRRKCGKINEHKKYTN